MLAMLMFCKSNSVVISRLVSHLDSFFVVCRVSCVSCECVCEYVWFCVRRWVLHKLVDRYIFQVPFGLRHSNGVLTMAVATAVDCNWVVWFKLPCRTTMVHIPVNILGHRGISQSSIIGCIIRAGKRE